MKYNEDVLKILIKEHKNITNDIEITGIRKYNFNNIPELFITFGIMQLIWDKNSYSWKNRSYISATCIISLEKYNKKLRLLKLESL